MVHSIKTSLKRYAAAALATTLALCLAAPAMAETYQVAGKLREDMSAFRFALEYTQTPYITQDLGEGAISQDGGYFYISSITVATESDGAMVQRIDLNPPAETYDNETFGFVLEDMNFDGFMDMRIMQFISAGVNIPYFCYLWDPARGNFAYSQELSAIPSPMFDVENKLVLGFERVSASEYIDATYAYSPAGVLTLTGRVITGYDYEMGTVFTTTEQLIEGQMQVVDQRREPLMDPDAVIPEITPEP